MAGYIRPKHTSLTLIINLFQECCLHPSHSMDFVLPINIAPCPAESPLVTKVDKLMAALLTNNTMIKVPVYSNIIILRLDKPNINDFSLHKNNKQRERNLAIWELNFHSDL